MIQEFDTVFDTVSIAVLFTPGDNVRYALDQDAIEQIEDELDGRIRANQGIDFSLQLSIPRHNLELSIGLGRIEVRSLSPDFSTDVGQRMTRFLELIVEKFNITGFRSIGHNFVVPFRSKKGSAMRHIEGRVLKTGLQRKLGHTVLGAAASLWLSVDESTLLLRLEPNRQSTTSSRYTANANFSVPIGDEGELPNSSITLDRLTTYARRLKTILDGLGL